MLAKLSSGIRHLLSCSCTEFVLSSFFLQHTAVFWFWGMGQCSHENLRTRFCTESIMAFLKSSMIIRFRVNVQLGLCTKLNSIPNSLPYAACRDMMEKEPSTNSAVLLPKLRKSLINPSLDFEPKTKDICICKWQDLRANHASDTLFSVAPPP